MTFKIKEFHYERKLFHQQHTTRDDQRKSKSQYSPQPVREAYSNGWLYRLKAFFLRRPKALLDLSAVKKEVPLENSHMVGRRDVSIDRIVGTEGRTQDFDRGFHPLCERMRDRWMRVASAILTNEPLPPIELIQVGNNYFVRDGHHRISVSRALGREVIEANVIAWDIADPYRQYGTFKNLCCA